MTSPVSGALGAQLGLAEGFGLLVDEVVGDSPAGKAGLQRNDVLKLLNDQQLVDPNQLAALVRAAGKNADVSLTFFRAGKEQKINVQVGERLMADRRPFLPNMDEIRRDLQDWDGSFRDKLRPLQDRMREFNDRMRAFQDRMREWQKAPNAGPAPVPPQPPELPSAPSGPKAVDILRETRPGGASEITAISGGKATTWNTARARVFYSDENGEITVSSADGKRTLVAKSKDGKVEFEGPIDSDEQRRALPEHLRKRLEKLDVQTHSESSSASAGAGIPEQPPRLEREGDRDIQ
jgi:S1-C subfamily serine protease